MYTLNSSGLASSKAIKPIASPSVCLHLARCRTPICHSAFTALASSQCYPREQSSKLCGPASLTQLIANPHHQSRTVRAQATSTAGTTPGDSDSSKSNNGGLATWLVAGAVLLGIVGIVAAVMSTPGGMAFKDTLVNGPLGKSGFLAAFSLIFLSEIGDKTFFIAALLAMKLGKWISFAGSLASLAVMTVISVGIGAVIGRVPDALKSSVPVGEVLGIFMLLFFGIKALREGLKADTKSGPSGADEELAEADEAVKAAEQGGKVRRDANVLQAFIQVATLIFIAEWGDRSMLATIALGAAQNPMGVATGAITGHAIATGIAVIGGALAAQHVSEKQINLISGVLFLVFAVATAWTLL